MLGLELVVVLGIVILLCTLAGRRLGIVPPVFMLICGGALGFVPALRQVSLPPETVLLIFLPALLYWESLTTSLREIRRALRGVMLMSTLLVAATAAAVAAITHALGLPWGPAWVLGAAIAPTDATSVAALGRLLPRRSLVMLQAESLMNDGTALVLYGVAVSVTVGEAHVSAANIGWLFFRSYLGGVAAGAAIAWVAAQVRRRLEDPLMENIAVILTPFTAFLLAQEIKASGVLAVVTCGLIMSQVGPRVGGAAERLQTQAAWPLATYVLNGALFVLVGITFQSAIRDLTSFDLGRALVTVVVVCATLILVRILFQFVVVYLIRALDRRPSQLARRVSHRYRILGGVAGFRGAVSLAAVLAVPHTLDNGQPFPDRDVIIFVTVGVIALLMLQAFAIPPIVRWTGAPEDTLVQTERRLAKVTATEEALDALPKLAAELGTDQMVTDLLQREYTKHLRLLQTDADTEDDEETNELNALRRFHAQYKALRLALLGNKRATVIRLRDERRIDDAVLRQIQARLDIEELRLSQEELVE
ncbi:MAG TPA: Na+/H+ antiporter [Actinospica sp.]|nr:Na+/H+ antiporter [Actinospica sp.]